MTQNDIVKQRVTFFNLHNAVLSTLAYFDIFDYPMTAWEAWKYLYKMKAEYVEVIGTLDDCVRMGILKPKTVFIFCQKETTLYECVGKDTLLPKKNIPEQGEF